MPALDHCHEQVVRALEKAGWQLFRSPANFFTPSRTVYIDLEMTRQINGTRQQMMLVEVKCFPGNHGTTKELYSAIGQYLIYRAILNELELAYTLYLSVPLSIFEQVFESAVMQVVNESRINIVVIDLNNEEITQWITH